MVHISLPYFHVNTMESVGKFATEKKQTAMLKYEKTAFSRVWKLYLSKMMARVLMLKANNFSFSKNSFM